MMSDIKLNTKNETIRNFNLASRIQSLYIIHEINKNRYKLVLDLGAGDGEITNKLQSKVDKLYSLDSDPFRVKRIRQKISGSIYKNTILNLCFAQKLPYEDSSFDLIVCNSVIEHIVDYNKIILEIKRTIKPSGIIIITVPNCEIQFGKFGRRFWNLVLKMPNNYRVKLCRNSQIASYNSIVEIQNYFNSYFDHKIQFNTDRLQREFYKDFEIIKIRYFLNQFSGFCHDLAYYFKIFDNKVLLKFCYFLGFLEFVFFKKKEGKGILIMLKKKYY